MDLCYVFESSIKYQGKVLFRVTRSMLHRMNSYQMFSEKIFVGEQKDYISESLIETIGIHGGGMKSIV